MKNRERVKRYDSLVTSLLFIGFLTFSPSVNGQIVTGQWVGTNPTVEFTVSNQTTITDFALWVVWSGGPCGGAIPIHRSSITISADSFRISYSSSDQTYRVSGTFIGGNICDGTFYLRDVDPWGQVCTKSGPWNAHPIAVPPTITVSPNSCNETVSWGDSIDVTFMLQNTAPSGADSLNWRAWVSVAVVLNTNGAVPNEGEQDVSKDALSSQHPSMFGTTGPQSLTAVPDQEVQLVIDDGSRENAVGLGAGGQFIWLNRFTPNPAEFPFTLDEIHILFGAGEGVNVGELVDIYVYEDTDGDGDPGTGANPLGTLNNAAVQFVDDVNFSVYPIAPIALNGPGDVIIAVVNRTAGTDLGEYPAAIDETASQGRSWVGAYHVGNPPDPPLLPADDLWGIIDSFGYPGNWMIRGFGSSGGGPEFIGLLEPTSGSIPPGHTAGLTVRLFGLQPDTTYQCNVIITSNDPVNRRVTIPVTLDVVVGIGGSEAMPTTYALSHNYPNPFNPTTTIDYQLPKVDDVKLLIYNVLGQPVRTLVNERKGPGRYKVVWDGRNKVGIQVSSGIYIYQMVAGDFVDTKKLLLLK